jgi:hypothetical protein
MRHFLANKGDDGGVMKESTIEHLFHVSVPLDDIKTSQTSRCNICTTFWFVH